MIAWLSKIWCVLTNIPCYIEQAAVWFLNGFLAAIGAFVVTVLALLPDMPEMPTVPGEFTTAASWVAWFFPVGTVVDILVFLIAAWLIWQAVAIGLRWAKAL